MFDYYGSKDSEFPKIYDVDAVGIGEVNREFIIPYFIIDFFKDSQSKLFFGTKFHKSNYNFP